MSRFQASLARNAIHHVVKVAEHLVVREANDTQAARPQVLRTVAVIVILLFVAQAVNLDRQPGRGAIEVDDVRADYMLPTESNAAELLGAQAAPKKTFRERRLATEAPSAVRQLGRDAVFPFGRDTVHSDPPPAPPWKGGESWGIGRYIYVWRSFSALTIFGITSFKSPTMP